MKDSAPYQVITRGFLETLIMRIGLAAVVIWTLPTAPKMAEFTQQERPTGLAHLFDLTFLAEPAIYNAVYVISIIGLALFVIGYAIPISLGAVTIFHILTFSLYNSQGSQTHAFQIVSLVLLAQWIVYLVGFFRRRKPLHYPLSDLAIHFSLHAIAATYVIAGVIKLMRSKGLWAWQTPDMSVELMKTNAQKYYEYLTPDPGTENRLEIATWLIENPMLTRILLGSGLVIEVFAFLALRNRFWALIGGFTLIGFHFGVNLAMNLDFKYNTAILWLFLVNVPFWIFWIAAKIRKRNDPLEFDLNLSPDYPWRKDT